MKKKNFILATFLIVIAACLRLFPQPANFSPIGAMALFSGAILGSKYLKYIIPLVILFVSDLILNNTILRAWYPDSEGFIFFSKYMITTYIAFVLAVAIGHFFMKKISFKSVVGGALGFSVVFFLISNFGSWLHPGTYPKSISGLVTCYGAGLPFLKNTIAGNLFYCTVLFGSYAMLTQVIAASRKTASIN